MSFDLGQILNIIKDWVLTVIDTLGYPGLALVMFLENIFPPIPSEVILPLAGFRTITGEFNVVTVVLVAMLGAVAGAWVFYGLGRLLDESRIRWLIRNYGKWLLLQESDLDKSLEWFHHYGDTVIFFGRLVPIVRSLISIPAGTAKMNPLRFTFFTALGTGVWNVVLVVAGRLLGQNWGRVVDFVSAYQNVILVLGVAAVAWFVVKRLAPRLRPAVTDK